jgi:restriction system protein
MKSYYRLMLGRQSMHAETCFHGNFIGANFGIDEDLSQNLPESWRPFNKMFIPKFIENNPGKTKVAAGLGCSALWHVCKGMKNGDLVLCPDGTGIYRVAEVTGDYEYKQGDILPHRRTVHWLNVTIERSNMSDALKNSTGAIGTISNISNYQEELEKLIGGVSAPKLVSTDETVEDASTFALEEHLEHFLVNNWEHTELGEEYEIYEVDGERAQQYQTDTGPLDILAISKDQRTLLVVELKKGRASDAVVGQILRYMSYVQEELAEENQMVKGMVIAHEDDQKMKRALSMIPTISFYRYQVSFKLLPND